MNGQPTKHGLVQQIPIELLDNSPYQVRTSYGDIESLAQDIKKHGLLQPILVRPRENRYEIVHGHRRTLAIKKLNQHYILAVVRELDDESALLIHGGENIHRKNLTPIEEGTLYRLYIQNHGKTLHETAEAFKVSRETVRYKVNLLDLPRDIQDKIHRNEITYDKARQLTILTRKPHDPPIGVSSGKQAGLKGSQPTQRTEQWYPEIREMADNVNLRTEKEVAQTARHIREGTPIKEAIQLAKMETAKTLITRGPTPEMIVKKLKDETIDVDSLREAGLRNYLAIVKELVAKDLLYCPNCGGKTITCKDCGRPLNE